jgi:hypothetical protein
VKIGEKVVVANGPYRRCAYVIAKLTEERVGEYHVIRVYSRRSGWRAEILEGPFEHIRDGEPPFYSCPSGTAYPAKAAPAWVLARKPA